MAIKTKSGQKVKILKRAGKGKVLIQYDDGKTSKYPIKNLKGTTGRTEVAEFLFRMDLYREKEGLS